MWTLDTRGPFLFLIFSALLTQGQKLVWGPVKGHVAHREAVIIYGFEKPLPPEVQNNLKVTIRPELSSFTWRVIPAQEPHILKVAAENLWPGQTYILKFYLKGKPLGPQVTVTTPRVYARWTPGDPPDFTFLAGSCFYLNDRPFDRPGKPYGQDSSIIGTMASTPADFNLLLGDNFYYREADWSSRSGMRYRYYHTFTHPLMARLLAARPTYAIWDDHDFGPNDADHSFPLRRDALELFRDHWGNPPNSWADAGIFTTFEYADAAFFLLDDRWFRAPNNLKDAERPFLGEKQVQWLVESLVTCEKAWKFVVCGNQMINNTEAKECYRSYAGEFNRLFREVRRQRIEGLIILSGDRHFSELLKDTTLLEYPLYELTCSPVTSTIHEITSPQEKNNPLRVPGSLVQSNNFSRLSIRGPKQNRVLYLEHLDAKGRSLWQYKIPYSQLKIPKP